MLQLFKTINGMNIVGQGGKIIIFTLPFAIIAVLIHVLLPGFASLPGIFIIVKPVGYVLLVPGILLWLSGVVQLVKDFPKGKLITTGAYGICRNPIYSSMILLVLPSISIITVTWVYFVVALFLFLGVVLFIKKEEEQLLRVFGKEYASYKDNISRVLPFMKPHRR
jgi:protein-S-isoprenylcysteine O-methyltransferase Ste14